MEKISVIVPCYNVEKVVGRCIESIMNQTIGVENIELILVNDASTDDTLRVLLEYEEKFPNSIMVINLEKNSKQGTARNIGLDYSTGKYIGFIDSDDYIEPNMYETLYTGMIENNCDFSSCGYERVDGVTGKTIIVKEKETGEDVIEITSIEDRKKFLGANIDSVTCSRLFRKDFLNNNNIRFLENMLYEDNYFGLLIRLYASKVYICKSQLYKYCFYPNGSTITKLNSLTHLDRLKVELIKVDFCKKKGFLEIYYDELEYEFLRLFFLNTFFILITRFKDVPKGVLPYMSKKVKDLFPDYINNKYINNKGDEYLLKCISMDLNDDEWNIISEAYKKLL